MDIPGGGEMKASPCCRLRVKVNPGYKDSLAVRKSMMQGVCDVTPLGPRNNLSICEPIAKQWQLGSSCIF